MKNPTSNRVDTLFGYHFAETNQNILGETFAICQENSDDDVKVIFKEDNSIVQTNYRDFRGGQVFRNSSSPSEDSLLGDTFIDAGGEVARIIEVDEKTHSLTFEYDDGSIVSKVSFSDAQSGSFEKGHAVSPLDNLLASKPPMSEKMARRVKNINTEFKRTLDAVVSLLTRYHKCFLYRPCGFGKTTLAKVLAETIYKGRKCLFLYPKSDPEAKRKILDLVPREGVTVMTYTYFRQRSDAELKLMDYDFVFCDEAHCLGGDPDEMKGAKKTAEAMRKFMAYHKNTHFYGATATPFRLDMIDVGEMFFDNRWCYPYTDSDADRDGILRELHYYFSTKQVIVQIRNDLEKKFKIVKTMSNEELKLLLHMSDFDIDDIDTKFMPENIDKICHKVFKDTSYMRFLVFERTNYKIHEDMDMVAGWFRKAFPKHQIESIIVTAESGNTTQDVDALPTVPTDPKYEGRIDLVFTCELMTASYHSELLSGAVMIRETESPAKYVQMIGRLQECRVDTPAVVFDVADNIHHALIYNKTGAVRIADDLNIPVPEDHELTFSEVVGIRPRAMHWEYETKSAEEARTLEKYVRDQNEKKEDDGFTVIKPSDSPATSPVNSPKSAPKKKDSPAVDKPDLPDGVLAAALFNHGAKERLDEPSYDSADIKAQVDSIMNDNTRSYADKLEAVGKLAKDKVDAAQNERRQHKKQAKSASGPRTRRPDVKPGTGRPKVATVDTSGVLMFDGDDLVANRSPENDRKLGYDPGLYRPVIGTGEWYGSNIYVENRRIDWIAAREQFVKTITKEHLDKILAHWRKTIEDEDFRFASVEEADPSGMEYKILKNLLDCARIKIDMGVVVNYIVTGTL